MAFQIPPEICSPLMSLITAILAYFLGHKVGSNSDK